MAGKVNEDFELAKGELSDLLELEDGLSDWALGFLDSVSKQVAAKGFLSKKQMAKIHELWADHCE